MPRSSARPSAREARFVLALHKRLTGLLARASEQRLALEATEAGLRMVREALAEYGRRGPQ